MFFYPFFALLHYVTSLAICAGLAGSFFCNLQYLFATCIPIFWLLGQGWVKSCLFSRSFQVIISQVLQLIQLLHMFTILKHQNQGKVWCNNFLGGFLQNKCKHPILCSSEKCLNDRPTHSSAVTKPIWILSQWKHVPIAVFWDLFYRHALCCVACSAKYHLRMHQDSLNVERI